MDARTMSLAEPSRVQWLAQEMVLLSAVKEREHQLEQMRRREVPLMDRERAARGELTRSCREAGVLRSALAALLATLASGEVDRRELDARIAEAHQALDLEGGGVHVG